MRFVLLLFFICITGASPASLLIANPLQNFFRGIWNRFPKITWRDQRVHNKQYLVYDDNKNDNVVRIGLNLTPEEPECACQSWATCLISGRRPGPNPSCSGIFQGCCIPWPSLSSWWSAEEASSSPFEGRSLISYSSGESDISKDKDDFESAKSRSPRLLFGSKDNDLANICGRSINAQRKIMGGNDAGYGQFPWTALISVEEMNKECAGTLVSQRFVLTAGHCVTHCDKKSNNACLRETPQHSIKYRILLGEYDRLDHSELFPAREYSALDVIRHPDYVDIIRLSHLGQEQEPRFDVALILLDRIVEVGPNISPICMPDSQFSAQKMLEDSKKATIVGWGRQGAAEDAVHAHVLQAITLPVLSDEQCLARTGLINFDDQVCVDSHLDKAVCPGDSGSALQVRDERQQWTIVGVVSNGPRICGQQPVVFHKLGKSLDWIRDVIDNYEIVDQALVEQNRLEGIFETIFQP